MLKYVEIRLLLNFAVTSLFTKNQVQCLSFCKKQNKQIRNIINTYHSLTNSYR